MVFLKDTGIIRRIDELGRIVIPKEIRKNLKINTGDNVEIYMDETNKIVLKKCSTLNGMEEDLFNIAKVINETNSASVVITDSDKVIVSYGKNSEYYLDQYLNKQFINTVKDYNVYKTSGAFIISSYQDNRNIYCFPLSLRNSFHGLLIIFENDKPLLNIENDIASYFKKFIIKQLDA